MHAAEPSHEDKPTQVTENTDDSAFADDKLDFLDEEGDNAGSDAATDSVADPIAPWNRMMYHFNDKLYFWLMKPLAQGYAYVAPEAVRLAFNHFFTNLTTPVRLTNCLLQGKGGAAEIEFSRFVLNTTVGVLGFGDPAGNYPGMEVQDEDLGQTFGRWGIGNGFYIVWPFLGPSTARDSLGLGGDTFLKPVSYVNPLEASVGITAFDKINQLTFHIGDYETVKEAAFEPYEAIRDGYIQMRLARVAH